MNDLIRRDKAVTVVLGTSIEYQLIYGKKEPKEGFVLSLIKGLANIPQEEMERKHGKWLDNRHSYWRFLCSECNGLVSRETKYCPNCGAKMINGDEQDNPAGS